MQCARYATSLRLQARVAGLLTTVLCPAGAVYPQPHVSPDSDPRCRPSLSHIARDCCPGVVLCCWTWRAEVSLRLGIMVMFFPHHLVDLEPRSAARTLAPSAVEALSKKMRKTQMQLGVQLQAFAGERGVAAVRWSPQANCVFHEPSCLRDPRLCGALRSSNPPLCAGEHCHFGPVRTPDEGCAQW